MAESSPIHRQIREVIGDRPSIDWPTALVILTMCGGFVAAGVLQHRGVLPAWATAIIGTLLMNLSFTAWHEPAHKNFSRSAALPTEIEAMDGAVSRGGAA